MPEISDVVDEGGDQMIRDLLLLINEDVSLDIISTWNEEQKWSVCVWAGRMFARASDNWQVRVPHRPSFLPAKEVAHE